MATLGIDDVKNDGHVCNLSSLGRQFDGHVCNLALLGEQFDGHVCNLASLREQFDGHVCNLASLGQHFEEECLSQTASEITFRRAFRSLSVSS